MRRVTLIVVTNLALPAVGFGQALTDEQIAARIIQENRHAYYGVAHPCACPDDLDLDGSQCGGKSDYSRPGSSQPKCYPKDVTKSDIDKYRAQHFQ
jgi:hypothetical protein